MARFYTLCKESGRKELLVDIQNDYYTMVQDIMQQHPKDGAGMVSRIRVAFEFTNAEGLMTTKLFHDLGKVEHFLLWDRAYAASQKGKQQKPDWSTDGLCAYQKRIVLGVAKFRGQEFRGFREDFQQEYYGQENE